MHPAMKIVNITSRGVGQIPGRTARAKVSGIPAAATAAVAKTTPLRGGVEDPRAAAEPGQRGRGENVAASRRIDDRGRRRRRDERRCPPAPPPGLPLSPRHENAPDAEIECLGEKIRQFGLLGPALRMAEQAGDLLAVGLKISDSGDPIPPIRQGDVLAMPARLLAKTKEWTSNQIGQEAAETIFRHPSIVKSKPELKTIIKASNPGSPAMTAAGSRGGTTERRISSRSLSRSP